MLDNNLHEKNYVKEGTSVNEDIIQGDDDSHKNSHEGIPKISVLLGPLFEKDKGEDISWSNVSETMREKELIYEKADVIPQHNIVKKDMYPKSLCEKGKIFPKHREIENMFESDICSGSHFDKIICDKDSYVWPNLPIKKNEISFQSKEVVTMNNMGHNLKGINSLNYCNMGCVKYNADIALGGLDIFQEGTID